VLGYLDPLAAFPAVGSLIAACAAAPIVAGALLAIACLTKLQAVFMAPVVLLATWNSATGTRLSRMASGVVAAIAVTFVVLLPYLLIDAGRNVFQGVSSLLRHDMLSADAANFWWIVTYVMRASYAVGDMGVWGAWTMTLRILGVSTIVRLGYANPRPWATSAVIIAMAWALWRARRSRDLSLVSAAAALVVHAYFVLGIAVHENHLYFALPLLALAAASRPHLRPIHLAVSAVVGLNLFLFFGLGRDFPLPPRNFTIIDATAILAAANCALFVWHVRVFTRESIAD
jgi:Gpi18-like mannosyltransferase